MTPENFVYWLQGYFELCEIGHSGKKYYPTIEGDQVKVIRDHINLVLHKKTPAPPFSFSCPPYIPSPVNPSGITTDPVYYQHNSPPPPASC